MTEQSSSAGAKPLQAIITVIALVPVIGILTLAAQWIGVMDFLFVGFVFVLYWTAIKGAAPQEFVPALAGSLGGLGLAYLVFTLPAALGIAGTVLVGVGVLLSIYLLVRGQAAIMVNNAFMLLLTLGTSRAFASDDHYLAAAVSIALAAAYTGALLLIGKAVSARTGKQAADLQVS